MAERRMMAKKIINSDAFLDMPISTQNLYFHLLLEGDDEGFVNSPKRIQRTIGASDDDAKILLAKKFIISFESGIIVIKHWRMHNYIQKDRFKPTTHTSERSMLSLKENNVYTMDTNCTPSIEEESIGEVSGVEVATLSQSHIIASYLLTKILDNKPNFKKPNLDSWAKDIDKAMRLDERTEQELRGCIDWIYSPSGSFWIPNILSGKKLREKFDTMEAQMMSETKKNDIDFSWMDELEAENAS